MAETALLWLWLFGVKGDSHFQYFTFYEHYKELRVFILEFILV